MASRTVAWVVAVFMGGMTGYAHHSIAGVYDTARQVTVEGVVTAFQFVNPHPFVELAAADAAGAPEHWKLELDNRHELVAVGMTADTLRPGDRLLVTGSAARDSSRRVYVRVLERHGDGFLYEQVGASPRVRLPVR